MEEEDNGGETNVFTKFGQMWNDYQELKNAGNYLLLGSVINGATRVGEVSNDAQKINNAGIFDTLGIPYSNKDLEEAVSDISRTREYDNNNENNKYIKAVFEKQKYTKLVAEKSDTLRQQHPEWNEKEIDWNAKYQVLIEKCGNLLGEEREQFVRDHLPEFKAYYDSGNNVINDLNYQGVNDVKSLIGEINIDPLSPATVDSQPEENYTIHPDSFGVNRRYNNQGIMHSDDLVSYFALDSAIRGALPTEEFLDKLDSASTALMFSVPGGQVEGLLGKLAAGLGKGSLMISRAPKVVIEAEEAVAKKSVEVTKVAGQIGRYTGELIHVNKADAAADLLAERIGGQSRVKFASDSIGREFDAVSNEYIAQTKPALQTLNKSVRDQMKATFEAAQETGKKVYYHFEGQPAKSVIDKLCEYSQRYGIEVIIDIKPLK